MPESIGGPRDELANERTQLAWLRTGINVMVVGLALARFAHQGRVSAASLIAGGILIATGALLIAYGSLRYRRVAAELREGRSSSLAASTGPVLAAIAVLSAVVVATVILLVSA